MIKEKIIEKMYPILLKEFDGNKIIKNSDNEYYFECTFCGIPDNKNAKTIYNEVCGCMNIDCKAYGKEFTILSFIKHNYSQYNSLNEAQLLQRLVDDFNLENKNKLSEEIDYFSKLVQYGFCFSKDARFGDSICPEHGYLFKSVELCPECDKETHVASGKEAISGGWQKQENRNPEEPKQWIADGFNVAVRTGNVSNITTLDFDAGIPSELMGVLGETFIQKSTKGFHYVYQYEADLPTILYKDYQFEILNNKKKFTIYPSKPEGKERSIINDMVPVKMPQAVKDFLVANMTPTQKRRRDTLLKKLGKTNEPKQTNNVSIDIPELKNYDFDIKSMGNGAGRNVILTSILGTMRRRFSFKDCVYIGKYINDNFFHPPLDYFEVDKIFESIDGFIDLDNTEIREKVCDYMVKVKNASKQDIITMLSSSHNDKFKDAGRTDIVLAELVEENKLLRRSNNYEYYNAPVFSDKWDEEEDDFDWHLKFFPNSTLSQRSTILVTASTGMGKTHIAMNLLKELKDRGIKPNYLSTEIDSKYVKIATKLGMKEGDFGFARCSDVRKVQLEKDSFTIIDWITAPDGDFSQLETQFKDIKDKQLEANAFVIIFMQAKEDGSLFATNLTKNYCTDVYSFMFEKGEKGEPNRKKSYMLPRKIRDAKEGVLTPFEKICTKFDVKTKQLKVLSESIKEEQGDLSVSDFTPMELKSFETGLQFENAETYKLEG